MTNDGNGFREAILEQRAKYGLEATLGQRAKYNRPGDEYVPAILGNGLHALSLVQLTPEARLEWRLSGHTPRIYEEGDPRVLKVLTRLCRGGTSAERTAFWQQLERLNARKP